MMPEDVSRLAVLGVAAVVIAAILCAAFAQRYHFVIAIVHGEPRVTKGKVHGDFLDKVREVCREYGVIAGWIGGVRRGKMIALRFSHNIPSGCQQRIRNIWTNS